MGDRCRFARTTLDRTRTSIVATNVCALGQSVRQSLHCHRMATADQCCKFILRKRQVLILSLLGARLGGLPQTQNSKQVRKSPFCHIGPARSPSHDAEPERPIESMILAKERRLPTRLLISDRRLRASDTTSQPEKIDERRRSSWLD
jgi:hypothetical protein